MYETREQFETEVTDLISDYGCDEDMADVIKDFLLETYHVDRIAEMWNRLKEEDRS